MLRSKHQWADTPDVLVADTPERCDKALRLLDGADVVGVDTESYGCNPKKEHPKGLAKLVSLQLASDVGYKVFVPLWGHYAPLLARFKDWLEDDSRLVKVAHNVKWDQHVLANHGVGLRGVLADTLVLDYLAFNAEDFHGLKECMRRYFNDVSALEYSEVFRVPKIGKKGQPLKTTWVPPLIDVVQSYDGIRKLVSYAVKDPAMTAKLFRFLHRKMTSRKWRDGKSYWDYYEMFERPFTQVLFEMEREGVPIDLQRLKETQEVLESEIVKTERELLHTLANAGVPSDYLEKFNVESPKQVGDMLFSRLGAKSDKLTDKGAVSTANGALESIVISGRDSKRKCRRLVAEVAQLVLRHRRLMKTKSTYVDAFLALGPKYGGRLHTTFRQTGTNTGRLSSSAPNLQNISAGKKDDEFKLRACFVPGHPGDVVADIDLSQIEVRVTAHFTGEQKLTDMLRHGWDQHLITMQVLYPEVRDFVAGRDPTKEVAEELEKHLGKAQYAEWRRRGKVLNFGCIYGMGPKGYVSQVGGTLEEAKIALDNYFSGYPGLRDGIRRVQRSCYERGYIRTFLGRYRELPAIRSQDKAKASMANRQAFNSQVQGSAADIIKMGMLLCHADKRLRRLGVRMVLQIHDELVFLIPRKNVDKAAPIIESYVTNPYAHFGMKPLVVETPGELGYGASWHEAKK